MFLPIGDENPRETTPYVNYTFLGLNVAAFLFFCFPNPGEIILVNWAMIPQKVDWGQPATWITLFTSMFLHANVLHLVGNMLFLWIFGDNVEDKLGHVPYLFFYLICGLAADFLHIATTQTPMIPTLGASGAISGVVGAYVLFFPRHRVKMLVWIFVFIQFFYLPAWMWVGIWFLEQLVMAAYLSNKTGGGVAYFAHIGGFLAGVAIGALAKFLIAPGRFQQKTARLVPEEIAASSRWGDPRRGLFEPLLTIDRGEEVEILAAQRYAVLRGSDGLQQVGRIAALASQVTGEPSGAVARRLEASRGVIARNVDRVTGERIQLALRRAEVTTLLRPDGPGFQPPQPRETDQVSWDEDRLTFSVGAQPQPVPWATPFLYLGAAVCREPLIDIYVTARHAFRVTPRAARLPEFARVIVEFHRGAALNDGVRVLAHRGTWGWLSFRTPEDFENYSFWLYTLLLSQKSPRRVPE